MKKLLAIVATFVVVPAVAFAHDAVVEDADDSAGRLDIKSVAVSHPDSGTIRYVITFYEPHRFGAPAEDRHEPADGLRVDLRLDGESPWRFKYVVLYENVDGGLYGLLRNHKGQEMSYVRAWRPDEASLAVDIKRVQLKRRGLPERADWIIETIYIDDQVCPAEGGDVPSTCSDSAPEGGFRRHGL